MGAVFITGVLAAMDQTIVGTALPRIVEQLRGYDIYAWVFASYYLGATATSTVIGRLSDLFGRKQVILLSVGLFAAGSVLCATAGSILALVAFRGLQGVGAGGLATTNLAIIGDMFSPRERGKWQTVNSLAFATASAIGPLVGGAISDTISWRWIFFLNLPLAAGSMVAMFYALPRLAAGRRRTLDWIGGLLTILGILSLMLALTWGGRQYPWRSAPILALLVLAGACGAAFWWVERRAKEPIVPPGLLRGPVVPYCCVGMFTMGLVWFGVILLGPLFLQNVLGLSGTRSGGDLTPAVVLSGASSMMAGWWISRSGRCKPIAVLGALTTIAGTAWLLPLEPRSHELPLLGALILIGIGIGWVIPPFIIALQNAVPTDQQGVTMGVMSLFRQLGATLGATILGVFVSGRVTELSPQALSAAVHLGVLALLAGGLLMLAMTLAARDVPLRSAMIPQPAS
ncbi:MAG TPA: MDR family MFS transporter [Chloroflexota bacterium]